MSSKLVPLLLAQQKALKAMEDELEANGLSASETLLLAELHRSGSLSPTTLAQRVGLSRGRLSHLLHRLLDASLIERRENPNDKRGAQIHISQKGEAAAKRASDRVDELWSKSLATLGEAGEAMLRQQLDDLSSFD